MERMCCIFPDICAQNLLHIRSLVHLRAKPLYISDFNKSLKEQLYFLNVHPAIKGTRS